MIVDLILTVALTAGVIVAVIVAIGAWILWMEALEDGKAWAAYPVLLFLVLAGGFCVYMLGALMWDVVR